MTRTTTSLDVLLHDALAFGSPTRNGLANHLPMALVALDSFGATEAHLQAHFDGYAARWSSPRRDARAVEELRDEIFTVGIDAVVRRWLPALVEGPGSQFWHSMIRLAFAVDARHEGQVAAALLDWRSDLSVLPGEPPASASLDDLAATVAAAHVTGADIRSLHLLTGVSAARVLAPHVDGDRLARRTAQAVAAQLRVALPPAAELDALRSAAPSWDVIAPAVATTHDPHVVKLAYACRSEEAATGDPLHRWLAAREARVLDG
jgi:hypothetical protein